MSFHEDNGISLVWEQQTSIRRLLEGYQSLRPPDRRKKLPSSEHHIQKMFMHCVDINDHASLVPGCAMLVEYSLLLRPGKIGYQPTSDEKNLYNESVTWQPNFENPQEISIDVEASKTNRWRHKTEITQAHCNCDESRRIIPCAVDLLKHWINMRNACNKIKFKSNNFTFIHKSGKLFRYDHLNNWLQNAMANVARKMDIKLHLSTYRARTLRLGGCTDMAGDGVAS